MPCSVMSAYIFSTSETEPLMLMLLEWHCGLRCEILTLHWNLCIFHYQRNWDMCSCLYKQTSYKKNNYLASISSTMLKFWHWKGVGGGRSRCCSTVLQALQLKRTSGHVQTNISAAWAKAAPALMLMRPLWWHSGGAKAEGTGQHMRGCPALT